MPDDGSATLRSTDKYNLFAQAENMHRPLREYLTGVPGPLTMMEQYLWQRFYMARARLQQQGRK